MRVSIFSAVNGVAMAVLLGLAGLAVAVTLILGPVGLVLLGLADLLICSQYSLDESAPGWGVAAFSARLRREPSTERHMAAAEERRMAMAPLPFFKRCGIVLVVAGCAALAWSRWH